jgi:hypothetical protein
LAGPSFHEGRSSARAVAAKISATRINRFMIGSYAAGGRSARSAHPRGVTREGNPY